MQHRPPDRCRANGTMSAFSFSKSPWRSCYQVFKDDIADKVDVPSVHVDSAFEFKHFLADGMATFDSRDELNGQLGVAAEDAVAMLVAKGKPGAPPTGEWAERAENNHQAVCDHYSYEVIGQKLSERMYSAFSATVKND